MQVLHIPEDIQLSLGSLPSMYTWPTPLKRVILVLATIACLSAYVLLIGGLLGALILLLELALD